jgi:hypothetical protein
VQIVQHAPVDAPSSFDRIKVAMERVIGRPLGSESDGQLPGLEAPKNGGGEEKPN